MQIQVRQNYACGCSSDVVWEQEDVTSFMTDDTISGLYDVTREGEVVIIAADVPCPGCVFGERIIQ